MSDTRRDIELRIRATDLSSADLNGVARAVNNVVGSIESIIKQAGQGTISLGELKSSITQLQQAGQSLTSIAGLIDRFKDLQGVLRSSATNMEANKTALAAYRTQLEGIATPTKANETQLAALVKQLEQSEVAYQRNAANIEQVSQALARSGVDVKNLVSAEQQLAATADKIGASLTKLNESSLNYAKNLRESKDATAQLVAEQKQLDAAIQARIEKANQDAAAATEREAKAKAEVQAIIDGVKAERIAREKAIADKLALQHQSDIDVAAARKAAQEKELADVKAQQERIRQVVSEARQQLNNPPQQAAPVVPVVPVAPATQGRRANAATASQAPTFVGLKPYELQNLSYQLNDIVTQLSSGTRISQVFAQQGGQILQLWVPNLLALRSYILPIIAGITAITVAVDALNHAFRETASAREFGAILQSQVTGGNYQVETLNKIRQQVRQFGVDWHTAGDLIKQGIEEGVAQDRLPRLIELSKQISDVTGVKVTDAFKNLATGLKGGTQGLIALNNQLNFLTKEQFDELREKLNNSSTAAQAQQTVIDLLSQKYKAAQATALSPFTVAIRELSKAWDELLVTLSNSTVIKGLVDLLTQLATALDKTFKSVSALADSSTTGAPPGYNARKSLAILGQTRVVDPRDVAYDQQRLAAGTAITNPTTANALFGGVVTAAGIKIDTASLQQLAQILASSEVQTAIGQGNRIQVFSSERAKGTKVAGTNTDSEHDFGRAFDFRLVDANGHPVDTGVIGRPGMGSGLPTSAIEAAVIAAANRLYPGTPVAVGGQFRRGGPDPGHVSIGGQEAINQANRRGETVDLSILKQQADLETEIANKKDQQKIAATALTDQQELQKLSLDTYNQSNRDALVELKGKLAQEQMFAQTQNSELADAAKAQAIQIAKSEQMAKQQGYYQQYLTQQAQDGKNAAQILAYGQAAEASFIKQARANGQLITDDQAHTANLNAQAEIRAKLQKQQQETNDGRALENQLAALSRQNEIAGTSDLIARLKAVDDSYTAIRNNLAKFQELHPTATTLPGGQSITDYKAQIDAQQEQARGLAEIKLRMEDVNSVAQTRNALIAAYKAELDAGAITVTTYQDKVKSAYDDSTDSINAQIDAVQKLIDTNKNLDPAKVELYTAKLAELRAQAQYISPLMKDIQQAVGQGFQQGLSQGFNTISEALGNLIAKTGTWKDVLNSLPVAIGQVFSTLFKDIAEAILKYEALKLASSLGLTGSAGGAGGGILSFIFGGGGATAAAPTAAVAAVAHGGGLIGDYSHGIARRSGGYWASAPRYHSGSTAIGLNGDEQRAILKRGEEVLTEDNPRNIANIAKTGKAAGQQPVNIRSILVVDEELIPAAMQGAQGEKIVLSHIAKNRTTIRQLVK